MSVNKYIIKISSFENKPSINADGVINKMIKIPITLDFNSVDQAEIVNRDFISSEVKKAINPIIDYEKIRFSPIGFDGDIINQLNIKLNFLNNGVHEQSTYRDIGFSDDDIKFQKNKFKSSFLTMNFFDSDKPTNQNLVLRVTLFSKLHSTDITPLVDEYGNLITGGGLPKNSNEIPVNFILNNPINTPNGFAEGFYLYYFKNIVDTETLFMKAEFNNAATGEITKFITTNALLNINELIKKLHVKYLLKRGVNDYNYSLDNTYNNANNIIESNNNINLDLYEIMVE